MVRFFKLRVKIYHLKMWVLGKWSYIRPVHTTAFPKFLIDQAVESGMIE